jgi:hypothetical protein
MANIFNEIKHALFLENEYWKNQVMVNDLHDHLVSLGIKCTVIDNASNRKPEIIEALATADAIIFESTFIYAHEVKSVGDLLKMVKRPLLVFGGVIGGGMKTLQSYIEKIWSLEECVAMSHHRVFQLEYHRFRVEDGAELYQEINMSQYKTEWDRLEAERIHKNHNMPKTGNKVLIKQLQAFGGQWSNLKEGDIVDELDCTSIDKEPHRGIWVMGKDEPVKLQNADRYEEWEFHEPSYHALTREFFARGNRGNAEHTEQYGSLFNLMAEWIRKCSSELITPDVELWQWCDTVCDSVGVERRGNRRYIERRIKEYRKRFHYLREEA